MSVWAARLVCGVLALAVLGWGQRKLRPGFNLFNKEQDIQLGKELAAEVEKQAPVVGHADLNNFIRRIGDRLAKAPDAEQYPYTFKVVQEDSINAFALPGGPTFTHTGLILAAENEGQIAGVLAHEISHVALRHGTSQASKAQLLQLPLALAGAAGGGGSLAGQLAQLGIGLGANSLLLKYSRGAERDADLLGTRIMSHAGFNPIEMARFFEKLEAQSGRGSRLTEFLASHPNPGNRVKAVQQEVRYLPQRSYDTGTGDVERMKQIVKSLPPPPKKPQAAAPGSADPGAIAQARPSRSLREYRGREFAVAHPENWEPHQAQDGPGVNFLPRAGVIGNQIGYGALLNLFPHAGGDRDLRRNTEDLVRHLQRQNPGMQAAGGSRALRVSGQNALVTRLESQSAYQGQKEVDLLITVDRPQATFYMVLIAPEGDLAAAQPVFDRMIQSIRFPN